MTPLSSYRQGGRMPAHQLMAILRFNNVVGMGWLKLCFWILLMALHDEIEFSIRSGIIPADSLLNLREGGHVWN
jgi:hypothetical protein